MDRIKCLFIEDEYQLLLIYYNWNGGIWLYIVIFINMTTYGNYCGQAIPFGTGLTVSNNWWKAWIGFDLFE